MSESTIPIVPTPAATRYSKVGEPKPPAPTTRTDDCFSFFWPFILNSGRTNCLEYLRSSLFSKTLAILEFIYFLGYLVSFAFFRAI